VPTLAVFAVSVTRPLFLERYLNGIAPAYYLLFAWGIAALATSHSPARVRRGAAIFALAVFVALSSLALANYLYNPVYAKSPDWRGLARAIDAESRKGDVILQNFPETSLVYYDRSGLPLVVYPVTYLPDAKTTSALEAMNSKYRRVWFIPAADDFWDPDQFVEGWLDRHDDTLAETRVGSFRLELYGTPEQFLSAMHPEDAAVGKFAALVGYRLERKEPVWHVVLYWRTVTTTKKSFNVFVHLVASGGSQVLAQVERPPVNATYPTNQWQRNELVVDAYDLPIRPTAAALAVGMYDPATSKRLSIFDANGNSSGDAIVIPLPTSP
jgi:hypothetical protein